MIQNVARYLISTIVFLALARFFLSEEEFGLAGLAMVVVTAVGILVRAGIGTAVIQIKDIEPGHCDAAFWLNVSMGAFWTAVLLIFAKPLASIFRNEELAPVIMGMAPLLILTSFSEVQGAILSRELRFRDLAIRTSIGASVGGVVGISVAFAGAGVWALVSSQLASGIAGMMVLWKASPYRPAFRQTKRHFKDLWPVALPMIGIGIVASVGMQADQLFLGLFGSIAAVGVYSVGRRIVGLIQNMTIYAFITITVPSFSRLQDDRERLRSYFMRAVRISSMLACMTFGFVAINAYDLINFLVGTKWTDASMATSIMAVTGIVYSIMYFFGPTLIAIGDARTSFRMNLIFTAMMVCVGFMLKVGTVNSVALLILGRVVVEFTVWLVVMKKKLGISPANLIKVLLGNAGLASVALVVSGLFAMVIPDLPGAMQIIPVGVVFLVVFRFAIPRVQPVILRDIEKIFDEIPSGMRFLRPLIPKPAKVR